MTSTTTRRLRTRDRADAAPEREDRPDAPAPPRAPRRSVAERSARTRAGKPAPAGKGSTAGKSAGKGAGKGATSGKAAGKSAGKSAAAAPGRTAGKGVKSGPRPAARPVTAPDQARGGEADSGVAPRRARAALPAAQAAPRAPFVLLVVGLLGGALVSLLLLNTVLAEDAFTLTELQRSNKLLNQQRQALQEEIALEESPERLAQKARSLGMTEQTQPAFIDEPTGRVVGSAARPVPHAAAAAAGAIGVVGAPGVVVPGDQLPGWGAPAAPATGSSGSANSGAGTQGGTSTGATGGAARPPAGGGR